MTKVLCLALYGSMAASTRYRFEKYLVGFAYEKIELDIFSLLGNNYLKRKFNNEPLPVLNLINLGFYRLSQLLKQQKHDLLIVHCELFPLLPGSIERALLRKPYIYDFDDAFYLKYRTRGPKLIQWLLGNKFDKLITGAVAVTAGSKILANYARNFNSNVIDLPTVVDTDRYVPDTSTRNSSVFTIGWIGSPSTAPYLLELVEPLAEFGKETNVRLVIIGGKSPDIANVEIVEVAWSEETEVGLINTFDVGVMPLPNTDWAQGKCAFKLIQYMACAVPVVASPIGANRDVVSPECGILAESSEHWISAFRRLSLDPHLRERLGKAGRQRCIDHYSLKHNLPILSNLIRTISEGGI